MKWISTQAPMPTFETAADTSALGHTLSPKSGPGIGLGKQISFCVTPPLPPIAQSSVPRK